MVRYEGGDWSVKVGECDMSAPGRPCQMGKEWINVVVTAFKYREAVGTEGERKVAGVSCWSMGIYAQLEG